MNIVVIDNESVKHKALTMLLMSNHNIQWANTVRDCFNKYSSPYMIMANYNSILSNLNHLYDYGGNNHLIQCIVIYGTGEDNTQLPMKVFGQKLGIDNLYTLGDSFSYSKLNDLIMSSALSGAELHNFTSIISTESAQSSVCVDAKTVKPYYQPKVSSISNSIVGYEVLGRLDVGDRVLPPVMFLEQLIASNSITGYTYLLVYNALEETSHLSGFTGNLSFNIDYQSLNDEGFFENLTSLFETFQFPFSRVILEISEKDPIYSGNVIANLTKFRKAGFGISIDDFGMADSGFTQLLNIPFTEIKIDRSYISEMQTSDYMFKIVKALASVASCMEVDIVAEGVECANQIALLKSINVNTLQGYYFSKPCPIEKILRTTPFH